MRLENATKHAPFVFDGVGKYATDKGGRVMVEYRFNNGRFGATGEDGYCLIINGDGSWEDTFGVRHQLTGTRIKEKRKVKGWYKDQSEHFNKINAWVVTPEKAEGSVPVEFEVEGE